MLTLHSPTHSHSHFTLSLIHTHTSHPHSFTLTLHTLTLSCSHFTPPLIHTHTSHTHSFTLTLTLHTLTICPHPSSFTPSQVVEVVEEEEEGWWRGRMDGKEGLFPSNFVEMMENGDKNAPSGPPDTTPPPKEKRELCVCECTCVRVYMCAFLLPFLTCFPSHPSSPFHHSSPLINPSSPLLTVPSHPPPPTPSTLVARISNSDSSSSVIIRKRHSKPGTSVHSLVNNLPLRKKHRRVCDC